MASPKAHMTVFTRSGCGHCTKLKNEALGLLLNDQELKKAGILVKEYAVGEGAGKHSPEEFKKTYNNVRAPVDHIRGFPTIELSEPGNFVHRKKFDEWVTWEGKRGADSIKAWALKTLKNGTYKANLAPAGSMDGPKLPKEKTDFKAENPREIIKIPRAGKIPAPMSKEKAKAERIFVEGNAWSSDEEF